MSREKLHSECRPSRISTFVSKLLCALLLALPGILEAQSILQNDGLVLHVSAEKVMAHGRNVRTLLDQSPRKVNLHSNRGSRESGGVLNAGALNGYATLSLVENGFRMNESQAAALNAGSSGLTLFLVAKVASQQKGLMLVRKQGGSVNDPGYRVMLKEDGRSLLTWVSENRNNRISLSYPLAPDWFVLVLVINPEAGTAATYYNGEGFTTVLSEGTIAQLTNANLFDLGWGNAEMEFAELAIYNRALPPASWNAIAAALADKYAIVARYSK